MAKDERSTNWAFEIYPDSAPDIWEINLSDTLIPSLQSPIHDQDLNEDGTIKKAHYHIQLCYETKKSALEVLDVASSIAKKGVGGCNVPDEDLDLTLKTTPIDLPLLLNACQ